ncbi:MAG: sodium:proton antiporter [Tissierellia bacterium]|nr:sodium:proton antiporter [Tissierellia bacterium]
MAKSLAIILLIGLPVGRIFERFKIPGLLGMLILGIIIGPYGLNILQPGIINISADLRRIALIIILLRAGLGIDKEDLRRNGITALKMSSIPAIIEGFFIAFASVKLLGFSFIQGGMLGFIIAAVSPAIVVPSMLELIENKVGDAKSVPTLILAGASMDDVFAITIFSIFLGLYGKSDMNIGMELLNIPISILLGILAGVLMVMILLKIFQRYPMRDTKKVLLIIGTAILLTELESLLENKVAIASLLGVMATGFVMIEKMPYMGERLAAKFNKIWIFSEILLFILVGAEVNIGVALDTGKVGLIIILIGILGRSIGVLISLSGTDLNWKERLFCIISYIPKATVQAAMGAIPLSMGVEAGDTILALAVLSILITAPLGAIGINYSAEKLL